MTSNTRFTKEEAKFERVKEELTELSDRCLTAKDECIAAGTGRDSHLASVWHDCEGALRCAAIVVSELVENHRIYKRMMIEVGEGI